jgi:hypothetical protein
VKILHENFHGEMMMIAWSRYLAQIGFQFKVHPVVAILGCVNAAKQHWQGHMLKALGVKP